MGFGSKTKTYVNADINNLYGNAEEIRIAKISNIESILSGYNISEHLVFDALIPGQGVKYRNFCYWCQNKEEEYLGNKTYNKFLNLYQPYVVSSITPDISNISKYIEKNYPNYSENEIELEPEEIILKGKTLNKDIIDIKIFTKRTKKDKLFVYKANCEKRISVVLGECIAWQNDKLFDLFKDQLYTGNTHYEIRAQATDDAGSDVPVTNPNVVYLATGYTYPEIHEDSSGNEYVDNVFYTLNFEEIDVSKYQEDVYITLIIYWYPEYTIDAYVRDEDGYLILDRFNQPIKLNNKVMPQLFYYEYTRDGYDGTKIDKYLSPINIDEVSHLGLILTKDTVLNDPLLKDLYSEPKAVTMNIAPFVPIRVDKAWYRSDEWKYIQSKIARKALGNKAYIDDIYKELSKTNNINETAYIYLFWGLPLNLGQLSYCARYIIQFFKQLLVPEWNSIEVGSPYIKKGNTTYFNIYARYNFNLSFSFTSFIYQSGSGQNPVIPTLNVGRCGYKYYQSHDTWVRQYTIDKWEYISIQNYNVTVLNIKNGKNVGWTGGANIAIGDGKKGSKRSYSKTFIPISREVIKNISIKDWTDASQYINNLLVSSYKVVKIKWYQRGIFKFILTIVFAVITIVAVIQCNPVLGTLGNAILGALGTAGGYLFIATLSAGISLLTAVTVNAVIAPVLTKLFGEFFSTILSNFLIIGLSLFSVHSIGLFDLSKFSILNFLTSPEGIGNIINSSFKGLSKINAEKLKDIQAEMNNFQEYVKQEQDKIDNFSDEFLKGFGMNNFWKYYWTTAYRMQYNAFTSLNENWHSFYDRTLMTAKDLYNLSLQNIKDPTSNFKDLTLD